VSHVYEVSKTLNHGKIYNKKEANCTISRNKTFVSGGWLKTQIIVKE